MSIATRADRQRAMGAGSRWCMVLPTSDGTIGASDRGHLLGLYVTAASPATGLSIAGQDVLGATGNVNRLTETGNVNILGAT